MLESRSVNIHYGKLHVVRDVSFHIGERELVSIIGANGAGKSTIIHALTGLRRITSGEILFLNDRIENLPSDAIVNRGVIQVPEGRLVFPQMSVMDNIQMGAYRREARPRRKDMMEKVLELFPRLKGRKKQLAGSLSGGEQQMLAIARALMAIPKLLLMDEPSLGLAPLLVEDIFRTITQLKEGETTVLLVEQNVFRSLSIADRAYILEEGKITRFGAGRELLEDEYIRKAYLGI